MSTQVDRWSRHLWHTSQHNSCPIWLGGRLQDQANEMRAAVGLEPFGWGDSFPDTEFGECTVHTDDCAGQEAHRSAAPTVPAPAVRSTPDAEVEQTRPAATLEEPMSEHYMPSPCQATARAVLGAVNPGGAMVRCGLTQDHEGSHVFHIEWNDPSPSGIVTDSISAYLASRRDDPDFRRRIQERMTRDAEILRRLKESDS